jgi:hypothetical protein
MDLMTLEVRANSTMLSSLKLHPQIIDTSLASHSHHSSRLLLYNIAVSSSSIDVPLKLHPQIIGSKGATIRTLQDATNTRINLPDRKADPPISIIEILGSPADVDACKRAIQVGSITSASVNHSFLSIILLDLPLLPNTYSRLIPFPLYVPFNLTGDRRSAKHLLTFDSLPSSRYF